MKLTCQSCLDVAHDKSFPGCFQREKAGERDAFGSLFPQGQMKLAATGPCRDAQHTLSRAARHEQCRSCRSCRSPVPQEGLHGAGRAPTEQGRGSQQRSAVQGAPAAQGGRYQGLVTLEHRCVLSISAGHAGPAPTAPKSKEHVRIPVVYGVTGE